MLDPYPDPHWFWNQCRSTPVIGNKVFLAHTSLPVTYVTRFVALFCTSITNFWCTCILSPLPLVEEAEVTTTFGGFGRCSQPTLMSHMVSHLYVCDQLLWMLSYYAEVNTSSKLWTFTSPLLLLPLFPLKIFVVPSRLPSFILIHPSLSVSCSSLSVLHLLANYGTIYPASLA